MFLHDRNPGRLRVEPGKTLHNLVELRALTHAARRMDVETPVLAAILPSNQRHIERTFEVIQRLGKPRIGVLGLSFKAGTDDLRESPLVTLVERVDLLVDPRLHGHPFSFGAPDTKAFVRAALDPIFAARTTAEWLARLREADIPCGPVRTRDEALADADARALGLGFGIALMIGIVAITAATLSLRQRLVRT